MITEHTGLKSIREYYRMRIKMIDLELIPVYVFQGFCIIGLVLLLISAPRIIKADQARLDSAMIAVYISDISENLKLIQLCDNQECRDYFNELIEFDVNQINSIKESWQKEK